MGTLTKKILSKPYLMYFLFFPFLLFSESYVEAKFIKKIAVESFSNPADWEYQFKPGIFFSSMLENSLTNLGVFQVVRLKKIESNVTNKFKSQLENKAKKDKKNNKDSQLNVTSFTSLTKAPLSQYKVRGNILIFNPDTNPLKKNHTKKEARLHKELALIQVSIELQNLHTGRSFVKKIFTVNSSVGRKPFDINVQNISYQSDTFKDHSMGNALWNLNDQVQVFIYNALNTVPLEGDLISIDHKNNSTIINLGKANGVNVQDVFTVFSLEPEFNDPVAKVDLGARYSRKGIIKVSEVQGRFSKAQIVAGVNLTPGDLVVPKNRSSKKIEAKIIPWTKRNSHREKKKNIFQPDIIWGDYKGLSSLSY